MIRATADFQNCCIRIQGHAEYAPESQDIVCAAVSALVFTYLKSLRELLKLSPAVIQDRSKDNLLEVSLENCSEEKKQKEAELLFSSLFLGLEEIANRYPENVKLIVRRP